MPKKASVTKEMIISVAIDIVQKGESLNVRAVANKLGCSIQPIFYNFATMDELKKAVDACMVKIYDEYVENCVKNSKYSPYKAIGMAYIGFARDYPEFFKQMFMDENGNKIISSDNATFLSAIESVCKIFGCDKQTAMRFHLEMWGFRARICHYGCHKIYRMGRRKRQRYGDRRVRGRKTALEFET